MSSTIILAAGAITIAVILGGTYFLFSRRRRINEEKGNFISESDKKQQRFSIGILAIILAATVAGTIIKAVWPR